MLSMLAFFEYYFPKYCNFVHVLATINGFSYLAMRCSWCRYCTLNLVFLSVVSANGCTAKCEGESAEIVVDGSSVQSEGDYITPERAAELLQAERNLSESAEDDDPFKPYAEANESFYDGDLPWNQGEEPLILFVEKFRRDPKFRRSRLRLPGDTQLNRLLIPNDILKIYMPDDTGFFASWEYLEKDSAVFCAGWLASEKSDEYVLKRIDESWYLVEYIDYSAEEGE